MDDLIATLSSRVTGANEMCVSQAELISWAACKRKRYCELLDTIGAELAGAYNRNELSYSVCDRIANDVWILLIEWVGNNTGEEWPETFYAVYDAFDAGEFHHKLDCSDDPVAEFTDPAIKDIVSGLASEGGS